MAESRIDSTDRLRREGRWEAASQFRDAKRREYKDADKKRTEANDLAWEAMVAEFPPLPLSQPDSAVDVRQADEDTIASILSRSEVRRSDPLDDVTWVYAHVGDENVAAAEFPSLGAWSMWNWARANRARFYERLWPKAEAARGERYEPLRDPVFVQTVIEIEEGRAFWVERMAEDLPAAMRELAANALWCDPPPHLDAAAPTGERITLLGRLMYQLSLRYVAASFDGDTRRQA